MEINLETVDKMLVAGTPALVIALGAFFTAQFVTWRMENMRIAAQRDMEREKIESQRQIEDNKRQIELLKTLYLERIAAAKKLTESVGTVYLKMNGDLQGERGNEGSWAQGFDESVYEFLSHQNAAAWLLGAEINEATKKVMNCVQEYYALRNQHDIQAMDACTIKTLESLKGLNETVSQAMLSDDLSRLFKKGE